MPSDTTPYAVEAVEVSFRYGSRKALRGVSLSVRAGELFGVIGPNGGGKTTLFRLLSTQISPHEGRAAILGYDVVRQAAEVRRRIGVVFQTPSSDGKLTLWENLLYQGNLYGMRGRGLRMAAERALALVGLRDRRDDLVQQLSPGLRRRLEIGKGILHAPGLLLLDEPSAGLDPGARLALWHLLRDLRKEGVTVFLTTHHTDEADQCDRLAVLHEGAILALDAPGTLKGAVGGDVVTVRAKDPQALEPILRRRAAGLPVVQNGTVRVVQPRGHELAAYLLESRGEEVLSVTVGQPTLEDVFFHYTGQGLSGGGEG